MTDDKEKRSNESQRIEEAAIKTNKPEPPEKLPTVPPPPPPPGPTKKPNNQ